KNTGLPMNDIWIRVTQGSNTATTQTGTDGQYLFFDSQNCTIADGIDGGCTGASTTVWTFLNGNQTSKVEILGDGASAVVSPPMTLGMWPTGMTKASVVSGST